MIVILITRTALFFFCLHLICLKNKKTNRHFVAGIDYLFTYQLYRQKKCFAMLYHNTSSVGTN